MSDFVTTDEQYLLVEEVAERLGLPLQVLLRRVEAGDIPARRIENENGVHYSLRLVDLGIESTSPPGEADREAEAGDGFPTVDITGRRVGVPADGSTADVDDHREPAQPAPGVTPPWLNTEPLATPGDSIDPPADAGDLDVPPPPVVSHPAALLDPDSSPRGDLAVMSLDARELVAGLLDRWERTLEQRIYTEQRQRFQGELTARQNMVKQLQMELHTARAEHAAAQAEKDRNLAEKERELADRERQLADARRVAEETERLLAPRTSAPRRRRFWHRNDD